MLASGCAANADATLAPNPTTNSLSSEQVSQDTPASNHGLFAALTSRLNSAQSTANPEPVCPLPVLAWVRGLPVNIRKMSIGSIIAGDSGSAVPGDVLAWLKGMPRRHYIEPVGSLLHKLDVHKSFPPSSKPVCPPSVLSWIRNLAPTTRAAPIDRFIGGYTGGVEVPNDVLLCLRSLPPQYLYRPIATLTTQVEGQ